MKNQGSILRLEQVGLTYRVRRSFFRHAYFEVLRDVNFDVLKGETLGIIGKNGCGKSTLLKILSGIFSPDRGTVVRNCQNVSLLSLNLAFDPELSGRSNAIIAGMFMGAHKQEVLARIDEIIAFSELEDYIEEPVKTYSSGMRARLGFSVALTMRAELILIDEVLGVGDVQFKKKAEAAMLNLIKSNQSVVLVSHAMAQITRLCDRVLWLDQGTVEMVGDAQRVVSAYVSKYDKKQ